ncbi:MAG: hypothetical protein B6A08_17850 [Sorangiineae bacterium NIC37A_2]|jgi:glycosyltransferase involved in cell wall biosynthesis|nr:MAG: hypothetical protein B6A08_17850 [Sorangiineae bacterium NIC37A_2]
MTHPKVLFVQPVLPQYRIPVFSGLAERGLDVTVWSDHSPKGSLKHVDPRGLFSAEHRPERRIGPFLSQSALLEAAKSATFDVAVFPWNVRYLELAPALLAARRRNMPVLLWGHARAKRKNDAFRRVRLRLGQLGAGCVTYDEKAKLELVQEGMDAGRIFVAQNAIDQSEVKAARDYWDASPLELARLHAEMGFSHRKVVLFVSRLERDKRVDMLLGAFSLVLKRVPDARLAVVGDGSERGQLELLTEELGIAHAVTFVGPVYDERQLAPWFLGARALAYPTNIGLTLLHSFSYGVPVITSDNPLEHNPEFVALRPGENGLVYRSGDASDFAEKIVACLTDSALRAKLSENARATVEAEGGFNLETMLDGMERALRFALAQRPRAL